MPPVELLPQTTAPPDLIWSISLIPSTFIEGGICATSNSAPGTLFQLSIIAVNLFFTVKLTIFTFCIWPTWPIAVTLKNVNRISAVFIFFINKFFNGF